MPARGASGHAPGHRLPRGRTAGLIGAAVGLAAAGTAVGVAVVRTARSRVGAGQVGAGQVGAGQVGAGQVRAGQVAAGELPAHLPVRDRTDLPAALLREDDPLGAGSRRPDRTALVRCDDGVLLSVEEIGPTDAPLTVVFVHGYALSMASWTFQRRDLAAAVATGNGHRPQARLVFYDQRGHGASGRGDAEHATIDQLADDLAAVLAARVPRGPVVLAGHSMGGMTVLTFAGRHREVFTDRVVGAALLSTSSGGLADLDFGLPHLLTRLRAAVFPIAAWTMRHRPSVAERTRRVARDLVSAATRMLSFSGDVDPALVRYVDAMIAGTAVDVIAEFYPALVGLDASASIEPFRDVPTLVLTGDDDSMIPMRHSELIVERLREGECQQTDFVVVPDAGHLVLLERPAEVTGALTQLLRRVAADRSRFPAR